MGLFGGEAFNPSRDISTLDDKVILVTGGNTGLGFETVKQLAAHHPSHIYLAARTPPKGEAAIAAIKNMFPNTNVTFLPLDLSSFKSISAATQEFSSNSSRLDILVNNAGIMAVPAGITKEGYEIQLGTNHMGRGGFFDSSGFDACTDALLVHQLLPILSETSKLPDSDVRIITLTSEAHNLARTGAILFSKAKLDECGPLVRYGYSKLANILYTRQLAAHYPDFKCAAVHPGLVSTDLYLPSQQSNIFLRYGLKMMGWVRGTVATGALNQLWAATAQGIVSGSYYKPVGHRSGGSPCAQDVKLALELWDWTQNEIRDKGFY